MPDHEMDEHIGCVLPRSERIALDAWAKRNDLSRSQAIRRAIRRLLAQANTPSRIQTRDDTVRRATVAQHDGDSQTEDRASLPITQ